MSIILNKVKTEVFSNISLELKKGEKIAILGKNGIGKTTFLRTLMGLVPFEGDIKIFDTNLKDKKDFKTIYSDVGYLFQDSNDSFIAPSVHEEVAFSLYNKTSNFNESMAKAENILKEFKIEHIKDKVPLKLSGGQKKIVSIAAVLAHEPKLLLLDEPANDLDTSVSSMLQDRLNRFDGSMIIIVHNINFAKNIVDKFYELTSSGLNEVFI